MCIYIYTYIDINIHIHIHIMCIYIIRHSEDRTRAQEGAIFTGLDPGLLGANVALAKASFGCSGFRCYLGF